MAKFLPRQFTYKGKLTLRLRIYKFFDSTGSNDYTTAELVERFKCSATIAARYRAEWQTWTYHKVNRARCKRCSLLDEPKNPVEGGLCQWCRWELEGLDLWKVYHSGMAVEVLGIQAGVR